MHVSATISFAALSLPFSALRTNRSQSPASGSLPFHPDHPYRSATFRVCGDASRSPHSSTHRAHNADVPIFGPTFWLPSLLLNVRPADQRSAVSARSNCHSDSVRLRRRACRTSRFEIRDSRFGVSSRISNLESRISMPRPTVATAFAARSPSGTASRDTRRSSLRCTRWPRSPAVRRCLSLCCSPASRRA